MFKKKIPFYIALLMTMTAGVSAYLISCKVTASHVEETDTSLQTCKNPNIRLYDFKFIQPLLFSESSCEAPELMSIKSEVQNLLNTYKISGTIKSGSVYLQELNQGEWMAIEGNDKYLPGSLLKVPELITFMKMNEKDPGLLDKQVKYDQPLVTDKQVHFTSKSIVPGNSYTIRELLHYMIAYSDNNATSILNRLMDLDLFKKTFTDLGLPEPDLTKKDIPISAAEYSYFMRAIFNAAYLNMEDSEYCAELLNRSDFADGLRKGIPGEIKMAHKFGEAGDPEAFHFSESGIIYINKSPYLLTIMTKGKDLKALPAVVGDISRKVYEMMLS